MKPERRKSPSPQTAQASSLDGLPDQEVSGIREDNKIDLRGAVVGEYRFHGALVRAFYDGGRTWFVAAEVCDVLDISNARDAVVRLEDDEKGVGIASTPGGPQQVNVISESAIYALIFKSRKSQARAFRRWVTSEVLPQIRRTGSYSVNGQISQDGSIVLPPLDGVTRYVVVGVPGQAPHIRRTGLAEMVAENTSLDVQGLCYALKAIEVWWNKLQILNRSTSDQDQGFSARQLEKAILEGGALADRYLGLLTYLAAAE